MLTDGFLKQVFELLNSCCRLANSIFFFFRGLDPRMTIFVGDSKVWKTITSRDAPVARNGHAVTHKMHLCNRDI